jgi:hypothetical protein
VNNVKLQLTAEQWKRVIRAAKFSKETVSEFAANWIMAGVIACEDDYIIEPHTGLIIGDRLKLGRDIKLN